MGENDLHPSKSDSGPAISRMAPEPMKRPVPILHQMSVRCSLQLIEPDGYSRSTKSQELDMPTLEASLELVLSTNEVTGAIVQDSDLTDLLVFALLRVWPLCWQIRGAVVLHYRGCGWLEPRDNVRLWSRVLSETKSTATANSRLCLFILRPLLGCLAWEKIAPSRS